MNEPKHCVSKGGTTDDTHVLCPSICMAQPVVTNDGRKTWVVLL